jgi:Putative transmembrane protein (PGPGW)
MLAWLILKPLAVIALVVGAITLPTPLPTGAPLIALGLAILVMTSATAREHLRRLRHRSARFDLLIRRAEPHVGRRLGVALRRTRPLTPNRTKTSAAPGFSGRQGME